ncbi:MAG TPA: hypothetical protein VIO11_01850, partial [Candidatus Methanoperedens sp.]
FVMEGYEKPVGYNGNISPVPQPVFFTATREKVENVEKRAPSEAATTAISSMYQMLGVRKSADR